MKDKNINFILFILGTIGIPILEYSFTNIHNHQLKKIIMYFVLIVIAFILNYLIMTVRWFCRLAVILCNFFIIFTFLIILIIALAIPTAAFPLKVIVLCFIRMLTR